MPLNHRAIYPAERSEWRTEDPQFLAEVLFAVTSMLSFTRLAYILPAHESLGTLQISIGKMIDDMMRCVLSLPVATPPLASEILSSVGHRCS